MALPYITPCVVLTPGGAKGSHELSPFVCLWLLSMPLASGPFLRLSLSVILQVYFVRFPLGCHVNAVVVAT